MANDAPLEREADRSIEPDDSALRPSLEDMSSLPAGQPQTGRGESDLDLSGDNLYETSNTTIAHVGDEATDAVDTTGVANLYSGEDPGRLETWHLSEQAEGIFGTIDTDGDQRLNTGELAAAVADQSFTGKDAQLVASLYKDREVIEDLVEDGGDGISMEDIQAAEGPASQESTTAMLSWYNHKSGRRPYTKPELDQVLLQDDLSDMHRDGVRFLRDNFDEIAPNGIAGKDELLGYLDNNSSDAGSLRIKNTIGKTYQSELQSGGHLFGQGGEALDHIVPEAVKQGEGVGDCYFLSAVAAVAAQRPQDIQNMIQENDDGTFTVTFPGARNEPVTVERPTPAEMGLYAEGTEHGIWPAVLEKAHGQYTDTHFWRRNFRKIAGGNTIQESADGGESQFSLGNGLELMTGNGVDNDLYQLEMAAWEVPMPFNGLEGAQTKLQHAMENQLAVLARFENHVAAVRDFDPAGPDGGTLTIYDQDNTQYDISLSEFLKKAHSFSYEEKPQTRFHYSDFTGA